MKVVSYVCILLLVLANAELVEFGEKAINEIFKEQRDAFILFSSPENTDAVNTFKESAEADSTNVFCVVDTEANKDHFQRFAEYLGINVDNTPVLIFMTGGKKKYVAENPDFSSEGLTEFTNKISSGEIEPHLKSAPIPENNDKPVKTIVGRNFKSEVLESDKEVLLKVYAPWCGHCKKIAPEFEAAAEAIAQNENIVLADFDGTLNEVDSINIKGYPTLLWYGKDKSAEPTQYNGGREKDGILTWLKDHTEYEWVEPQQAEAAPEEEL